MYKPIIRETFIVILLAVLFGGVSLMDLGDPDSSIDPSILKLRHLMNGITLLIFLMMSHFKIWHFPSKPLMLTCFWYLFSFAFFLSGFFHDDLTIIRDSMWLMIAIPVIFFSVLPKLMNKSANFLIAVGLFLGLLPYIFTSLWLHPIWQSPQSYRGVFYNSNQLGTTGAAISASIFILLIGAISKKKNVFYILILNFILFSSLIIILLSNARTSLIAFLIMFAILCLQLLQKPNYLFSISLIITATMTIVLNLVQQNPLLLEQISRIQNKESISGRDQIWLQTIKDMQLLGNHSNYFDLNFGMGGHNSIIDILGVYGIFAAFFLTCFAISSFYYTYSYFKKYAKDDAYAIAPFLITTCFWVIAMTESMFGVLGNALTQAYMMSMGVVIHHNKR
ncbi:MAG: hypothetical protein KME40_25450 [Komarekiella atlantica HA4396-MV6]|jgi:O-antigen ligase|nr:hypothetical protein [Komarekiella atlantica HA4396-MV6]